MSEKDIFDRLRQTCLLKIQVMQKYPWIFDFIKGAVFTDSEVVKDELVKRRKIVETSSFERFYGDIDTSRFEPPTLEELFMRHYGEKLEGKESN